MVRLAQSLKLSPPVMVIKTGNEAVTTPEEWKFSPPPIEVKAGAEIVTKVAQSWAKKSPPTEARLVRVSAVSNGQLSTSKKPVQVVNKAAVRVVSDATEPTEIPSQLVKAGKANVVRLVPGKDIAPVAVCSEVRLTLVIEQADPSIAPVMDLSRGAEKLVAMPPPAISMNPKARIRVG